MTYLVIAKDGRDADAPARRARVRARHLEEIRPLVEEGSLQLGGALLDDAGTMIGSAMLLEADSEEEVRALVERDVYTREGVWVEVEIHPFRRAV